MVYDVDSRVDHLMSELGRILAEKRAEKEISLADVEKVTRIRQKYLMAFEQGDYASLPRGAVGRGFLRVYAGFLGLDVDTLVRQFNADSGDREREIPIAEVGKPRLVDYRPVEVELLDTRPNLSWVRWVLAAVLALALAAAAWWYLSSAGGLNSLAALGRANGLGFLATFGPQPTTTATATATANPTPTRWIVTATPGAAAKATPTSDLLPLPTPTVPPTITPTPRPTATPEIVGRIALTVAIEQTAWIRVTADNTVLLEGLLEPGITRTWEATATLKLLTGNAGGVKLTLNGDELGKMGSVGQVIERTWIVDKGQVTEQAPTSGSPTPTR